MKIKKTEVININQKTALLVLASFISGFIIASGAFMITFCPECFTYTESQVSVLEKCESDTRCIADPISKDNSNKFSAVGNYKIELVSEIVNDPIIQDALKRSNDEFSAMSDSVREQTIAQREKEWISAQKSTPFMLSIIENDVSDYLREKTHFQSEEFGDIIFGEHILTNIYGPNVAVTVRTDNYNQGNDEWWESSKNAGILVRQCDYDESAQMNSEDIIIKILNENGQFIGIMNSATPCDVLLDK